MSERLKGMNYAALKIIQHEKGEGKFIVSSGYWHTSSVQFSNGQAIPGLSDLLGLPSVVIRDATAEYPKGNHTNYTESASIGVFGFWQHKQTFDHYYSV